MQKKIIALLVLFILTSFTNFVVSDDFDPADDFDWVIDDDTVYCNNSIFYASATPHTIQSNGCVTFEFESKEYNGNVDFIWGFNSSIAKPTAPIQIWMIV